MVALRPYDSYPTKPLLSRYQDDPIHNNFVVDDTWAALWPLIFSYLLVPFITSLVMANARVRHHWRQVLLWSWTLAIIGTCLFFNYQAGPISFFLIAQGTAYGFVDPFLDVWSFRRDPRPLWTKTLCFIGASLHHSGGIQIYAYLVHSTHTYMEQANDPARPAPFFKYMEVAYALAILFQAFDWGISCTVILRTAPKWFRWLEIIIMTTQLVLFLFVAMTMYIDVPAVTLWTLAVGQLIEITFILFGHKRSTCEFVEDEWTNKPGKVNTHGKQSHVLHSIMGELVRGHIGVNEAINRLTHSYDDDQGNSINVFGERHLGVTVDDLLHAEWVRGSTDEADEARAKYFAAQANSGKETHSRAQMTLRTVQSAEI